MENRVQPAAAAVVVPHPPIILPGVGKGEEKKIADIDQAYHHAMETIAKTNPDTVVIISPHAPAYADYIQVSSPERLRGSMAAFNDPQDVFDVENDSELAQQISRLASKEQFAMGTLGVQDGMLDHGTMVPLWYLRQALPDARILRVSVGGLSYPDHYRAGELIARAAGDLNRRIAVIASGDLSHCQKAGTHYGYQACGPAYDAKVMKELGEGDFLSLMETPQKEAADAMSCGHPSVCMMAGTLDGYRPHAEATAHSAVFGVGYGVAEYTDPAADETRHLYQKAREDLAAKRAESRAREDAYVTLARNTIESWIKNGTLPPLTDNLPEELLNSRAGAFVSLHENGALRGCIGSTEPTQKNLALEIMANAVSASTKDPRFPAVRPDELEDLDIHVDVLKPAEPCTEADLDPKQYGVIVTKGHRRGLLLPDLDGVDTVEQQLAIAKQKAGIRPDEQDVSLERFKVVRHQ